MNRNVMSNNQRKNIKIEETERSYSSLPEGNIALSKEKDTNLSEPSKAEQLKY